jgi:hypothetical protein
VDYLLVAARDGKRVRLRWFSRRLGRFATEPIAVTLPPLPPDTVTGTASSATATASGPSTAPGTATAPATALVKLRGALLASFQVARTAERTDAALAAKTADQGRKAKKVNGKSKIWKKWYFWVAAVAVAGLVAGFAIKDSLDEEKVILKITRP